MLLFKLLKFFRVLLTEACYCSRLYGNWPTVARTCNPSNWEADIWGWLEVRRSTMLHYTVNQANTVRPSFDHRLWWYRLRRRTLTWPGVFLESRSWWGHDCVKTNKQTILRTFFCPPPPSYFKTFLRPWVTRLRSPAALFVCNIAQKLQAQTIYYRLILYVLTYVYVSQNW